MAVTARLRNQSTRYSGDVSEGRQPVDPAPRSADAVDVVLDFLNSVDVECGTDEMRDGGSWDAWIAGRPCFADLPAEGADGVRRARPLRDYLRAGALGEQATAPSPVAVDVTFGGVDGSAVLRGAGTTGRVAASVAELPGRRLPMGVLRQVPQLIPAVVLDGGLRQPRQGPQPPPQGCR